MLNVLHGWGMNAHLFDDWSEQLARYFQVNLIDLPGHGLNHTEPLKLDLDALAAEAADVPAGIWLGWSMGGTNGCASRFPPTPASFCCGSPMRR